MKVTVFNGSPAGPASATQVLAGAFLRGAKRAGAETETVFLAQRTIGYCQGCFACWFQAPGRCVQRDDMDWLLETYRSSDIVCFGTPVYTWNMTAMLKNFVDRLIPLKSPAVVQQSGSFDLDDAKPRSQRFVVLANSGFPGDHNFETLHEVFSSCHPALEIYRSCGKLLKSRQPQVLPLVESYLKSVEDAGVQLVSHGAVSQEVLLALEKPLMTVPDYIQYLGM